MSQKTFNTRIINKHDTEENWQKAVNFIPKKGELIVYDAEIDANGNKLSLPSDRVTPYLYSRFKMGNGVDTVNNLPFISGECCILTDTVTKDLYQLYISEGNLNIAKLIYEDSRD